MALGMTVLSTITCCTRACLHRSSKAPFARRRRSAKKDDNLRMENVASTPADQLRRNSRQRDAVQQAIEQAGQPLLPQEILALAQAFQPTLGIATVYRNLKILVEAGEVISVELPGEAPRYESAHRGHHHHFHCSTCRQVFDIPGCPPDLHKYAPRGFKVASHDFTLYGTCAGCEKASRSAKTKARVK